MGTSSCLCSLLQTPHLKCAGSFTAFSKGGKQTVWCLMIACDSVYYGLWTLCRVKRDGISLTPLMYVASWIWQSLVKKTFNALVWCTGLCSLVCSCGNLTNLNWLSLESDSVATKASCGRNSMFPEAAALQSNLHLLGTVGVNDVFTLRSFPADMEVGNHDEGTTIDITNCRKSRAEICLALVLWPSFVFSIPPYPEITGSHLPKASYSISS